MAFTTNWSWGEIEREEADWAGKTEFREANEGEGWCGTVLARSSAALRSGAVGIFLGFFFTTTFIKFYLNVSLVWDVCGFSLNRFLAWLYFVPSLANHNLIVFGLIKCQPGAKSIHYGEVWFHYKTVPSLPKLKHLQVDNLVSPNTLRSILRLDVR